MVIERKRPFRFVSRSVPFISFSSVSFRFIAFHSVHHVHAATVKIQLFALQKLFPDLQRDAQRYPWPSAVQPSRLLHTRCSANLLPVAQCSSTFETSPYALFSQSPTRGPVQFNLRDFSIRAVQPISYPWPGAVRARFLHTCRGVNKS